MIQPRNGDIHFEDNHVSPIGEPNDMKREKKNLKMLGRAEQTTPRVCEHPSESEPPLIILFDSPYYTP